MQTYFQNLKCFNMYPLLCAKMQNCFIYDLKISFTVSSNLKKNIYNYDLRITLTITRVHMHYMRVHCIHKSKLPDPRIR